MRKLLLASMAALMPAGAAIAQDIPSAPAPGTVVVRLHGLFQYQLAATNNATINGNKEDNTITDFGFVRVYLGFDAMSLSGIQYGVDAEIREATAAPGPSDSKAADGVSTTTQADTLYIRRAYGYVGSAHAGFLRVGMSDGSWSLMQYGVLQNFGDGQLWDDDGGLGNYAPGGPPGQFMWAQQQYTNTTTKIVYITPSLAGVSVGLSYEPNSNAFYQGYTDDYTSATSIPTPNAFRRKNTFYGMAQYVGKLDGVGIKASAGEMLGSPLGSTSVEAPDDRYKQIEVSQAGVELDYGGLALGGNVKWGQVTNNFAAITPGQRDGLNWFAAATYTRGRVIVGSSVFHTVDAAPNTVGPGPMYNSTGVAVGATYTINPYASVFVTYLYGQEHQANGTSIGPAGNAHQNAIGVGTALRW